MVYSTMVVLVIYQFQLNWLCSSVAGRTKRPL